MSRKVNDIDLEWLLKIRIAVARCGEMDVAKWWNTDKQLASSGALVLRRGFPRTYRFAQARSVIAAANHRCAQIFNLPKCLTLWRLTDEIEESFDVEWEAWLERSTQWQSFFDAIAQIKSPDLIETLRQLDLVAKADIDALKKIKTPSDGPAFQIPGIFTGEQKTVALLALGFSQGKISNPIIPYMEEATV